MESPVRICLGAALVVTLLLLSGSPVNGSALPTHNVTSTTVKNERSPRYSRNNGTLLTRSRPKPPDDSLNELNPKDATIEEHAEKNAKYKDRGRVTYQSLLKSSTESPLRRIRSTEEPKLVIVTPTAESKKPAEIIDSMRTFKKTKLPVISSSSTPVTLKRNEDESEEEDAYEDEEDEEEKEEYEKFSSNKYNFFTMPSYGEEFIHDTENESSDNKVKNDYSNPSYSGFSSLFPGEPSYGYKDTTHDVFKSESFFSFDSDLTTPKNDFFDKKYQSISKSIMNKLDTIKTLPPQNTTNTNVHKIITENLDMEKVGNNTPSNKSSVFIKNTKEIRLLDNDGASSADNKELSDVHGTSIYYEMSVLSTETYNINTDDDCDNDSLSAEPTVGTSSEEELLSTKAKDQIKAVATLPTIVDPNFQSAKVQTVDSKSDGDKQTTTNFNSFSERSTLSDQVNVNLTLLSSTSETIKTKPESKVRAFVSKFDRNKSRYENFKSTSPVLKENVKSTWSNHKIEGLKPASSFETVSSTPKSSKDEYIDPTFTTLRVGNTANPIVPNPTFESIQPTYSESTYDSIKSNFADTESFQTIRPTFPDPAFEIVKPNFPDPIPERVTILSNDFTSISSELPLVSSIANIPVSTQTIISSTDRTTKSFSGTHTRHRSYSKRLNSNGNKDSPNSVTSKIEVSSTQGPRLYTRKFHYSTPRNKPVWMAPRRNVTKTYVRPTYPTTIYSEHFNIKDKLKNKLTTIRPKSSYKIVLTTISSDIDPVLQNDIGGTKKTVQSQSIFDNTVPSLWKRGSTKFASTTLTSSETDTEEGEWQIPPTSTAWALASLISPPPAPNTNGTTYTPIKNNVDEELEKNIIIVNNATSTISPVTTIASSISNDIIPKKVVEIEQNKLSLQPTFTPLGSETQTEAQNEIKSETIPAESNISVQSSVDPATTSVNTKQSSGTENSWVPVTFGTGTSKKQNETDDDKVLSDDKKKITGFESITKLPGSVTPPQDETAPGSEASQPITDENLKTTTDYEITTIRFSYVPTERIETDTQPAEDTTPTTWHPIFPTRIKITTDSPITTYRPQYATTTESIEESTTVISETTSQLEVSSQVLENATKIQLITTALPTTTIDPLPNTDRTSLLTNIANSSLEPIVTETTSHPMVTEISTQPATIMVTTEAATTMLTTQPTKTSVPTTTSAPTTTLPITTEEFEDTTTIVVEVVTEINTERQQRITSTTVLPKTTETSPSELHDTDCTGEDNEVVTHETLKTTTEAPSITTESKPMTEEPITRTTSPVLSTEKTTTEIVEETTVNPNKLLDVLTTTKETIEDTTQTDDKIEETPISETTTDSRYVTSLVGDSEDSTGYFGEVTTKASSITLNEEDAGSGAAIAIAVSTIGVIALILLIGLLLVVRRRGRRGVYAQRCTPVSLDAYSLDSVSVGHRKGNHRLRASKRSYGNPAYDDEVTSHPMQYAALANFALDIDSMSAEFAEIPSVTVRPDEVPPGCEDKNRYSNVLPLPETRVPLRRIGNDSTTEYINANYITGPGNIRNYYIACQAPLSNTVVDFWRMIWEQNSRLVVMLTEYMENGIEKCYEYLPPSEISDNKRMFGEFKIILKKREQRDKYAVSSVQLINLTTRTWREITHLWYFWPAKGVPDDYDSVIDFLCEMRSYMKISQTAKEYDEEGVEVIYGDQSRSSFSNLTKLREESGSGMGLNVYSPARAEETMKRVTSSNGTLGRLKAASEVEGIRPCVVTCASGAGRSAALVALDICARALPAGADVPRVVRHLRAQRPHSLSNRHHYIFVYKVLSEYGHKTLGGGMDTI